MDGPPRLGDLARDNAARGPSWTEFTVPELIEHLVATHHGYLVSELPRLIEVGARVVAAEGESLPHLAEVLKILDQLDEDLGSHLATEEEVLFPWCQRLYAGEPVGEWVAARVRYMRREHANAGSLLDELRRLTDNFTVPAGASPEYRALIVALAGLVADLRLHIHKEEDVLFPAVLAGVPVSS